LIVIITNLICVPFQGSVFDPDNGDCLHIELAKSNSRKRHGGTMLSLINRISLLQQNAIVNFNTIQLITNFMLGGGDVYRVIDKRVHRTEENSDNDNNGDEGDDDVSGDGDGNGHTFFDEISHL
jgi:hypothetical protein